MQLTGVVTMDSDDAELNPSKCPHGFYVAERVVELTSEAPDDAPLSHRAAFKQANTEWLKARAEARGESDRAMYVDGDAQDGADFYDPALDDEDGAWLQQQRNARVRARDASDAPSSAGASSSALLSCPSCFGTLCTTCEIAADGVSWRAPFAQGVLVCTAERVFTAAAELLSSAASVEAAAAAASGGWYYVKDEQEHGPFTLDGMRQWAAEGYFGADLPVRRGAAGKLHAFGSSECAAAKSAAETDLASGGAPPLAGADEMVPTLRVRCAGCNLDVGVVDTALDVYLFKEVLPSFA